MYIKKIQQVYKNNIKILTKKIQKVHLGNKIKDLVVNKYRFSIVEFAQKLGMTNASLHQIFKKEDVSTHVIKDVCNILNIKFIDFFCDCKESTAMVSEPSPSYGINTGKYIELLEENRDLRIQLDAFKDINKPYKKISLKK